MTDKEKADCLIELHREQLGKFRQTRDIEWKVNLAFWSLIILAGYSLKKEITLKENFEYCIYILCYLLVAALITFFHYKFWMKPIIISEKTDDHFVNQYRTQVELLTGIKIEKFDGFDPKKQKWVVFEVSITALLLLLVGFYIAL